MGHLDVDRHRLRGGLAGDVRRQPLGAGVDRAQHHGEHRLDARAREGRVHQPTVPLPGLAVGDEDAVAGQGAQHVVHQSALGELVRAAHQDVPDQFGLADHVDPPLLAPG